MPHDSNQSENPVPSGDMVEAVRCEIIRRFIVSATHKATNAYVLRPRILRLRRMPFSPFERELSIAETGDLDIPLECYNRKEK